ncbi:MAG: hypothetical protein NUV92_10565 [Ignavibacteria bacterium]|jgi:CRISPR-associated protein Cst1|nr:hypothetical protein [Ignavibacteria bacterium]MDH7528583.1 hypothetical protein [Ignavibacteria bacterium]
MNDKIILYPSNWLYNAGVVGLIQTQPDFFEFEDNLVIMDRHIFQNIDIENYFDQAKIINLKGNNKFYPNFIDKDGNQKEFFIKFVESFFDHLNQSGNCHICGNAYNLDNTALQKLISKDAGRQFIEKVKKFDMVYNRLLGPSLNKYPNGAWNLDQSLDICNLCTFLLIHHHLSYTKLSDRSEIFINAPSFKLMYELNRLIRGLYGQSNASQTSVRELFAISIIEYSRRLSTLLSEWLTLNIEVVIKTDNKIDFFSLPAEVSNLISDRDISALLAAIGESKILNLVLDQNYSDLIDYGYKFLRIGLKDKNEINEADRGFIDNTIKMERNRKNLSALADQLFKLYSIIEEKLKENQKWNYRN